MLYLTDIQVLWQQLAILILVGLHHLPITGLCHLASNFMTRLKDKLLKNLVCKAALASTERKFNKHMATIGRINSEAQQWLEGIPF